MKIVRLYNIKTNTMINGHKIMKYKKLDIYFNSKCFFIRLELFSKSNNCFII